MPRLPDTENQNPTSKYKKGNMASEIRLQGLGYRIPYQIPISLSPNTEILNPFSKSEKEINEVVPVSPDTIFPDS